MKCPKCSADSRVTETRSQPGGSMRRRRICERLVCGHRFTTAEVVTQHAIDKGAVIVTVDVGRARALRAAARDLDELLERAVR